MLGEDRRGGAGTLAMIDIPSLDILRGTEPTESVNSRCGTSSMNKYMVTPYNPFVWRKLSRTSSS